MIKDYFVIALRTVTHRKIRSWLTILGIFIGIAAVVSLISISQGMQESIQQQFENWGTNKLIVMPGSGSEIINIMMATEKLTSKDLDIIEKTRGVDIAAEIVYGSTSVEFGNEAKQTFLIGLPTDETVEIIKDMEGFEAEKGRDLKNGDKDKTTIGYLVAKEKGLFEKAVGLRDKISIKGKEFSVVGIIKEIGNRQDDMQIYIPLEEAKEILDKKDEVDSVFVQVKDGYKSADVAEYIKKALRKSRGEKEGEETFSVQTFEQLLGQVNIVLGVVGAVFIGVAAISLLVGGIGIMNTMYTSVLERRKEIGIMKAIGAKNSDILLIFLIESGFFGFVGGVIGVVLGVGLAKGVEIYASMAGFSMLKASITPELLLLGFLFGFLFGALAGTLPARQASMLKPVDALRYE